MRTNTPQPPGPMNGAEAPAGRVAGKVVVITGAARGQGATDARALAAEGATVVATDSSARRRSRPANSTGTGRPSSTGSST